jgi:hypothetical protein
MQMPVALSRVRLPVAALAVAAVGAAYVGAVDPHRAGHYPTCPFLALTGRYCPGCGGLRMTHDLVNGKIGSAFHDNALIFLLLPFVGYLWVRWATASARGEAGISSRLLRPAVLWGLCGVAAVFWVVRNLPFGHALAP